MSLFTIFYEASENNLRWPIGKAGCLFYSPSLQEGSHSRKLVVVIPSTNIPVDGGLSSGTTCSYCFLPRHSHT
jgi:hypothetical protein